MRIAAQRFRARGARILIVAGLVGGLVGIVVGCTPPDEPTGHRAPGGTNHDAHVRVGTLA